MLYFLFTCYANATEPSFYETIPTYGQIIILSVAFAIPAKIIFAHIGLFEFLHTDSFPKPPALSKGQKEVLIATIVGTVFGSLLTVIFLYYYLKYLKLLLIFNFICVIVASNESKD